jgi:hypothetical protein
MALTRSVWISLFVATAWMLLAFLCMWWQPILADEWDFYRSVTNWQQNRAMIPHPQAYVHLAQLCTAIFGPTVGAIRLVGVFCGVVSVWQVPLLVHFVWPDHPQRSRMMVIGVWLTALNPLTLQNAMLIDIDNTLLVPTLTILICVWAALLTHSARTRMTALTIMLAVALWGKLSTPPLLMGAVGLYHLARREWKRATEIVLASVSGLVLFGLTFAIYSRFTGFQLAYFAPTFGRVGGFLNLQELIVRFPQGMGVFVMWLSLPLVILLGVALATSVWRIARRQTIPSDALSLYVVIVALFYPLVYVPAWGYPRYQAPLVPIISVLVAALLTPFTLNVSRPMSSWLAGTLGGILAFNLLVLPDPLWLIYRTTFEGDLFDVWRRLLAGLVVVAVLGLLTGLILLGGYIWARARQVPCGLMCMNLLGVLTIASFATVSLTQITAPYSTRYRYTYDYADYLWSVRQVQSAGDSAYVLAIKEIWLESGLAGEEIYPYFCASCAPNLLDVIRSRRIDVMAWTTKEDTRSSDVTANAEVIATLDRCYTKFTRGVFIVYRLKPGVVCS